MPSPAGSAHAWTPAQQLRALFAAGGAVLVIGAFVYSILDGRVDKLDQEVDTLTTKLHNHELWITEKLGDATLEREKLRSRLPDKRSQ